MDRTLRTLAVAAATAAALGFASAPAGAASGELAGTWTSTDLDGSSQTLVLTGTGMPTYAMALYDDAATLCDGDPARFGGSGFVDGDLLSMRGAAVCLPGGNRLRGVIDFQFEYDAGSDTLVDFTGVVWSRAG